MVGRRVLSPEIGVRVLGLGPEWATPEFLVLYEPIERVREVNRSDIAHQQAEAAALRAVAKRNYEKQVVGTAGAGAPGLDAAGPPTWSREAWEAFRAQYGFYPFSATELPKTFAGAPDWVYELMGLRKPPVAVGG